MGAVSLVNRELSAGFFVCGGRRSLGNGLVFGRQKNEDD